MTDSIKVQECKRRIKIIVGEAEYLDFIQRLATSIEPVAELSRKYLISEGTLLGWINTLGYRDATTRRCLNMHYKRLRRIKEREIKNEKLTKFLLGNAIPNRR